jgi:hypothetical protein
MSFRRTSARRVQWLVRLFQQPAKGVSREVVQQMIKQALLKQAGIVITRLDDKRVSVTYNDKLELQP